MVDLIYQQIRCCIGIFFHSTKRRRAFLLPILLIRSVGYYKLHLSDFALLDIFIVIIISLLLFDADRSLRIKIVSDYEKKVEKWGAEKGIFFTGYPPKDTDDIVVSAIVMIAVTGMVMIIFGINW